MMLKTLYQLLLFSITTIALQPATALGQHVVQCGDWNVLPDRQHLRYDATNPLDLMVEFRVELFEQGSDSKSNKGEVCQGTFKPKIYFWGNTQHAPEIGSRSNQNLMADVLGPNGRSLSSSAGPIAAPRVAFEPPVSNENTIAQLRVRIPAGQFQVPRGRQSVLFNMRRQNTFKNCRSKSTEKSEYGRPYTVFSDCGSLETEEAEDSVHIPIYVVDTMSIRIAGAGRHGKVNFGTLEQGEKKRVNIISRSSRPYDIDITSRNGGVLRRQGRGGAEWSIDYSLELDSQVIDLTDPTTLQFPEPKYHGSERHNVQITIGSVDSVRAGRYRDLITFRISPRL